MKFIDLSTNEEKVRSLYRVIGYVSLIIFIITGMYGLVASAIQGIDVVGLTYVTTEFPPPEISLPGLYAKPITWLFVSGLLLFYSTMQLNKKLIMSFSKTFLNITKLVAFVGLGIALYETYFNFAIWTGFIAADAILGKLNPDLIINPFPNPETPWSVVFATKIFVLITIIAAYYLFYLSKLESEFKREK